jgi:hypothetical protein
MQIDPLTLQDVVEVLRRMIARSRPCDVAAKLGVTRSYLSDVVSKWRPPGPKILRGMGLRKVVIYEQDEDLELAFDETYWDDDDGKTL